MNRKNGDDRNALMINSMLNRSTGDEGGEVRPSLKKLSAEENLRGLWEQRQLPSRGGFSQQMLQLHNGGEGSSSQGGGSQGSPSHTSRSQPNRAQIEMLRGMAADLESNQNPEGSGSQNWDNID